MRKLTLATSLKKCLGLLEKWIFYTCVYLFTYSSARCTEHHMDFYEKTLYGSAALEPSQFSVHSCQPLRTYILTTVYKYFSFAPFGLFFPL